MDVPATGYLAFASDTLRQQGILLRPACDDDRSLLQELFASTRAEELRQVPWTPEQKVAFTDWQSSLQEQSYSLHYPGIERVIIGRESADRESAETSGEFEAIGRVYVQTTATDMRLMEITLLPVHRGRGIGTRVISEVVRHADTLALPISLHVEPLNPAKRIYERMKFEVRETLGLYELMVRPAGGTPH